MALGVFSYGLVFGLLAEQAGLSAGQGLFMSAWVFAGASQFVALEMWGRELPVAALIVTTLVVNLRHVLMGAALAPQLRQLGRARAFLAMFFIADENWALTMAALRENPRPDGRLAAAWLLGGGIVMYLAWVAAGLLGRGFGSLVADPARYGLDFAFTAVFLAILVGFWRGRRDSGPGCGGGVARGGEPLAARQ